MSKCDLLLHSVTDDIPVWSSNPSTVEDFVAVDVWKNWVPAALKSGLLVPRPRAEVHEGGLEKVQDILNLQKKGVSAKKLVLVIDGSVQ